jgi:hypothetical protein
VTAEAAAQRHNVLLRGGGPPVGCPFVHPRRGPADRPQQCQAAGADHSTLGNYMATSFVTAADGHGGTLITEAAQTANQLVPFPNPTP